MGILLRSILLAGSKGRGRQTALFDGGASYSIVRRDIAEALGGLEPLPDTWEFETAEAGRLIQARFSVRLDFYFDDSRQRFSDEFIVFDDCSEAVVIGVTTMQKWSIKLDFEGETVVYRKTAERLRVL
jgi:hypothetical protein